MKKIYLLSIFAFFTLNLYCQVVWKKYPDPVMSPGSAVQWDKEFVGMGCVINYKNKYHMWYTGGSWTSAAYRIRIGHATSDDGITWEKDPSNPVLDKGPTESWDETYVHVPQVLVINDTFHMWYTGHRGYSSEFDYQIGHATSPDGTTWTKDLNNPVLEMGSMGTWDYAWISLGSVLYDSTLYHLWYQAYDGGSIPIRIGHATSPDGLTWTKDPSNPVLTVGLPGTWDYPRVDFPSVVFNDNVYHMWYSGGNTGQWDIGYATSTDGSNWTKSSYNPVMSQGGTNAWDSKFVVPLSVIDSSGVKYKMWYWGSKVDETGSIGYAEAYHCFPPLQPSIISGNSEACTETTETYSVINNTEVTYSWSVTGGTISGDATTNSIDLTWNSPGTHSISVIPSNIYCGAGPRRLQYVTVNSKPTEPDTIIGELNPGLNNTCNYSISQVGCAISYNWEVSSGGNIIDNRGDTISVVWTSSGPQTISVWVKNCCGDGDPYILDQIIIGTDIYNLQSENIISVYPNPVKDNLFIKFEDAILSGITISIFDIAGRSILNRNLGHADLNAEQTLDLSFMKSGLYLLELRSDNISAVYKIIKE